MVEDQLNEPRPVLRAYRYPRRRAILQVLLGLVWFGVAAWDASQRPVVTRWFEYSVAFSLDAAIGYWMFIEQRLRITIDRTGFAVQAPAARLYPFNQVVTIQYWNGGKASGATVGLKDGGNVSIPGDLPGFSELLSAIRLGSGIQKKPWERI